MVMTYAFSYQCIVEIYSSLRLLQLRYGRSTVGYLGLPSLNNSTVGLSTSEIVAYRILKVCYLHAREICFSSVS